MVGFKDTAKYRESLATGCMFAQNDCLSTNRNGSDRIIRELQEQLQDHRQQIQNFLQTCQTQEERFSGQIAQKDEAIEQKA